MDPHKMRDERHRVLRPDPFTAELNALRSETARLRALLDERTALLRDAEVGRQAAWHQATGRYFEDNLSRRIAATLKETT